MTLHRFGLFNFVVRHKVLWLLIVLSLGVFIDQTSKIIAQKNLAESYEISEEKNIDGKSVSVTKEVYYPTKVVEVIPNFLNLIYKENPAAAFSLTHSIPGYIRRPMLIAVSILASIFFLFWYFHRKSKDGVILASFSFILAGAIGNLADRIRLGYVIDFIDVHAGIFGYPYIHWPTFNIADSLIVIGAIGVAIKTLMPQKTVDSEDNT